MATELITGRQPDFTGTYVIQMHFTDEAGTFFVNAIALYERDTDSWYQLDGFKVRPKKGSKIDNQEIDGWAELPATHIGAVS